MAGVAQGDRAARDTSAVLRDATIPQGVAQFAAIQSVAPSFGVELRPIDSHDVGEIERGITGLARLPNGGLIVTAGGAAIVHRDLIIALADRHRLPAVYSHATRHRRWSDVLQNRFNRATPEGSRVR